ncbi:MAG: PadR family transcriptional regulator [Zestosphaera sp.]
MLPGRGVFKGYMKLVTLNVLRERPRHVYGLIKEVEGLIGFRPSTGVIYPVLKKLMNEGLVSVEESVVEGKTLKTYRVTEKGLKYLDLHEEELKEALRLADFLKKFRQTGCDRLFGLVREITMSAGRLSEAELMELRKAITDFEARVLEILTNPTR